MATIVEEAAINAPAEFVWEALADVGALHTRLAPGFVVDTKMEGEVRIVTFANGMTAREPIISVDRERRRIAWANVGGALQHYSASAQVFADGPKSCRFVWTADLLPHEMAGPVGAMIKQGTAAAKAAMEAAVAVKA